MAWHASNVPPQSTPAIKAAATPDTRPTLVTAQLAQMAAKPGPQMTMNVTKMMMEASAEATSKTLEEWPLFPAGMILRQLQSRGVSLVLAT